MTAVWSNPQHLDLFITDTDGRVMSTWWESARSWQPWFAIHPESARTTGPQPVTAVWSNPQHLDLFITDTGGRVMSTWWENAKSWQPWFAIFPDTDMRRVTDGRNVVTQAFDNQRTGAYLAETSLKPSNVSPTSFGRLYERKVEGQIFAQPLYLKGVQTRERGTRDLAIVATAANMVYAFDANNTSTDDSHRAHL